jgi:hypothetical protein
MQLSPEEAAQYAEACAAVARHYDIGASAKALDIANLVTTMSSIYGVRMMAIYGRRHARPASMPGAPPAPNGRDQSPGAIDLSSMTHPSKGTA